MVWDNLLFGLKVAFIGLSITFLLLGILILAVKLLQNIAAIKSAKKSVKINAPQPKIEQTKALPVVSNESDDEIVAAITACISAMLVAENNSSVSKLGFRVRSIREIK